MTTSTLQPLLDELAAVDAADDAGGPLLEVEGVDVRFGGLHALAGITVDVHRDELVAIVGPNGAGKTTLLNAISGLLGPAVSGTIRFGGNAIVGAHPASIAELGIGRSFQHPPMIETETVLHNILLGAHLRLRYRMFDQVFRRRRVRGLEGEAQELAHAVLEIAGLRDIADEPVGGLPYGSRKLIDIVRTLMASPRLVLLDEPTSGLDVDERAVVRDLLLELRRTTNLGILMVEHHMDIVRATADRVIGLQAGAVLAVGATDEVLDSEAFRVAVVGTGQTPSDPSSDEEI